MLLFIKGKQLTFAECASAPTIYSVKSCNLRDTASAWYSLQFQYNRRSEPVAPHLRVASQGLVTSSKGFLCTLCILKILLHKLICCIALLYIHYIAQFNCTTLYNLFRIYVFASWFIISRFESIDVADWVDSGGKELLH